MLAATHRLGSGLDTARVGCRSLSNIWVSWLATPPSYCLPVTSQPSCSYCELNNIECDLMEWEWEENDDAFLVLSKLSLSAERTTLEDRRNWNVNEQNSWRRSNLTRVPLLRKVSRERDESYSSLRSLRSLRIPAWLSDSFTYRPLYFSTQHCWLTDYLMTSDYNS